MYEADIVFVWLLMLAYSYNWTSITDLNRHQQSGSLLCYHYTNTGYGAPGATRTRGPLLMGSDTGLAPALPNINGRRPTNRTYIVLLNPLHYITHLTESDKGNCSTY